jgi:GH24 family phage-related lysozyme (muramidase)
MDSYTIFPNRDGRTYTLFDGKNALPADTIEFEQIKALASPVGYGTPMQRGENATVLRTLKGMKVLDGLPPDEAQFLMDNQEAVIRLLASNDMSFTEKTVVRTKLEAARLQQSLSVRDEAKKMSDLTRHGDILNDTKRPLSYNLPAKMAPGTPPNVGDLAKQFYGTNPGAALAIIGEGYSPRVYKDQGGMAIGLGYNISTKSPDQVRKDFRAAGVPPQDIDSVLDGRRELTPQQAVKLFENSNKKYEETAKQAYGPGYDKLPKEVKAVLFDMAYNAGTPGKFPTVLNLFRQGKYDEAAKNLTLKFKDENGNWKNNERRVQLWREMLSGDFVRVMDRYSGKRKAK